MSGTSGTPQRRVVCSGKPVGALAWELPVPLQPTPLEQIEKDSRRRARRLRAHQGVVRDSAYRVLRSHLAAPPLNDATPYTDEPVANDSACPAG